MGMPQNRSQPCKVAGHKGMTARLLWGHVLPFRPNLHYMYNGPHIKLDRSLLADEGDGQKGGWSGDNGGINDVSNTGRTDNIGPQDPETKEMWSSSVQQGGDKTSQNRAIKNSALISGNNLFFGTLDNNIRCIDSRNGSELWTFSAAGPVSASPILLNGALYIGSQDSSLYALNSSTGALLWKTSPDSNPIYSQAVLIPPGLIDPTLSVYAVLVASGRQVRALSIQNASDGSIFEGDEIWSTTLPGRTRTSVSLRSTPAVNLKTKRAFLSTGGRQSVMALNLTTGKLIWVGPLLVLLDLFAIFYCCLLVHRFLMSQSL